ncbi:MAG: hypothetical protein H8E98_06220 [Bacteroidetes bacterium]|nr:hypothetical protein [Bacteroidota bacterium]
MTKVTDTELKKAALQEHTKKSNFPTEVIDLPSKGLLYPEEHPLRDGKIEIRYMTAKDEDILTTQSLIKKMVVIDKLLESIIVTPINMNDLLIGDKNAIMISTRILGYGAKYNASIICPNCGFKNKKIVDLNALEHKPIDESLYKNGNEFSFELPNAKSKLKFKLLTHLDNKLIDREIEKTKINLKKSGIEGIDSSLTTRLSSSITLVDGNDDLKYIKEFVDTMLSSDSRALRSYISEVSPDVDMDILFDCDDCGEEDMVRLVPDVEFFWPGV